MSNKLRALLALVAVGLMALGFGPMISPATATGGGNEECPAGTTLLAKYNWQGGSYVEEGSGVVNVSGTAQSGAFTADSGYLVSHVIVKGSNNAKTVPFNPPVASGSFNNVGLINNGGQTADISNVKFCGSEVSDPEGSNNSSSPACQKIMVGSPSGVKPEGATVVIKLDGDEVQPGTYDATPGTHVVTTFVNGTEVDRDEIVVGKCAGDQPVDKVTYTEWVDGDKSCEAGTVSQTRTKTVTPYKWDGSDWVLDTANTTSTTETGSRPMTEAELKKCEGTPPPDDSCPALTGSVKTTLADGSVVNGNIYQSKSDVYVSGSQLGDVTTVYVRVTDPSASTVLSDVKQVSVTDGSFGPVQLPTFANTPNNGNEYKVWVSSTVDFESKCTKFDNFKVKGDEPPPAPDGMSTFSTDCELLEITAPTGVKPEDALYQYYLDGDAIAVGSHELAPGDYVLTLEVNGEQVDSDSITITECEEPPSFVVTVVPNQGDCEVRTPVAQVTTNFASTIGYKPVGGETTFVYPEAPAGTYTLTLPGVLPGSNFSYEVVVSPLDDSAEPIVKGPFSFAVPTGCDEEPPCVEFQDEDAAAPCYVEREPDVRTDENVRDNCKLGGTETTTTVYTTTWSFNEVTQQWESSETGTSSTSFEPYTGEQLAACDKSPENPEHPENPDTPNTPTANPPTFVPPSTGGGIWPTGSENTASQVSMLSKLLVLLGGGLLLVTVFAPRRRKSQV